MFGEGSIMFKKVKNWINCRNIDYKGLYEAEKLRADKLDVMLVKFISQVKAVIKEVE